MNPSRLFFACAGIVAVGLLPIAVLAQPQSARPSHESASRLIEELSRPRNGLGIFSCGLIANESAANQSRSLALVKLGPAALPPVRDALESIATLGDRSPFIRAWDELAHVYAKLQGPAAFPTLRSMADHQPGYGYDGAIALALGLTSYVDASREREQGTVICRAVAPRYPLDRLILAWLQTDLPSLKAGLGPDGRAAMKRMLADRSWSAMLAAVSAEEVPDHPAVGYKFEVAGPWSKAEMNLDGSKPPRTVSNLDFPTNPTIDTRFASRTGNDCGQLRIRFLLDRKDDGWKYLVDDANLEQILRVLSSCVAAQ
jgi:hypothetical protein